jgi:hypothetical protein
MLFVLGVGAFEGCVSIGICSGWLWLVVGMSSDDVYSVKCKQIKRCLIKGQTNRKKRGLNELFDHNLQKLNKCDRKD